MSHDPKDLDRKMMLIAVMLVMCVAVMFMAVRACGISPTKREVVQQQVPTQPPPPEPTEPQPPTPPVQPPPSPGSGTGTGSGCGKVTFVDVQPILTQHCVSCHFAPTRLDTYAVASSWAEEAVRRTNLTDNDRDRMPLPPNPPLSVDEKKVLIDWVNQGKLEKCDASVGQLTLDYIETAMLDDLNRLDPSDRVQARYLITAHKVDEGATRAELDEYRAAIDKTLNSLNPTGTELFKATPVDAAGAVWRFDLRGFDIQAAEIKAIEAGDRLKIVSHTDKGVQIRQLAGTNQPWFHADNFMTTTHSAPVYYKLLQIPGTIAAFQKAVNVDFSGQLKVLEGLFIGTNSSPISELKNRLLVRVGSDVNTRAYYWQTFDTNDQFVAAKNLFAFPFLNGTGGSKLYQFDASEVIYSLPNGLQGYALFNAQGVLQNAAPLNVVRDNQSPITPEIRDAISCQRCHNGGLIPAQDQVRDHVVANAGQFGGQDVEIAKALYKPATVDTAAYTADDKTYSNALASIGISATNRDPITACTDKFLLDWDLKRTAAFLLLTPDELKTLLPQSQRGVAQVGQLLTGGTITYEQFVQVLPILIEDLRLFEEAVAHQ